MFAFRFISVSSISVHIFFSSYCFLSFLFLSFALSLFSFIHIYLFISTQPLLFFLFFGFPRSCLRLHRSFLQQFRDLSLTFQSSTIIWWMSFPPETLIHLRRCSQQTIDSIEKIVKTSDKFLMRNHTVWLFLSGQGRRTVSNGQL